MNIVDAIAIVEALWFEGKVKEVKAIVRTDSGWKVTVETVDGRRFVVHITEYGADEHDISRITQL